MEGRKWAQCPWEILVEMKAAFVNIVMTGGFTVCAGVEIAVMQNPLYIKGLKLQSYNPDPDPTGSHLFHTTTIRTLFN